MLLLRYVALLCGTLGLLAAPGSCDATNGGPSPRLPLDALPAAGERIRGVTFDARREPGPGTLERLHALGATHVTLTTFGFQQGHATPEIRMHTDGGWYSESDTGIRALAAQARALGMAVILKPHVWVGHYDTGGQSRDYIDFETKEDWLHWESDYRHLILHYAHLSQEIDAPLFVIGTELAHVARTREAFWRALIEEVRTVYDGPLTYAANWWGEYDSVPFWDALDYVGVQGYFELTDAENPSAEALQAAWEPHRQALRAVARQTGRPILFTEIGYRSVPYAAARPWQWPARDEAVAPDTALQARLYDAFFECLWHEPWFAGAILWKWHPGADPERRALDFSPQDKPAEVVIRRWFTAGAPGTR